ncbi:copper resistance protein B [Acinetobacter baumannii]|uniref:copper resistance protein B n=1 Tax=Acinetobacter baumannii TaxID=470 RepID=UPI0019025503|nr:copper resistance protein B [Acinetobacter baumannii]
MRITKLFSQMICCGAFSGISVFAFAQEPLTHDHLREHGGQVYQATKIDTGWTQNEEGEGSFSSELESWVGTDENKLFIKAHVEKAESEDANYGGSVLYSRNVADYWDVQAGVNYERLQREDEKQDRWAGVVGLHGMAPYFFETDAYLYAGEDQLWKLSLETERDLLFTQKLIGKPYLKADVVLKDESRYASKTGLSSLQAGFQTRYEINKKVMPFVDFGYGYEKGLKQTAWQTGTGSEHGWYYGAGLTLKF